MEKQIKMILTYLKCSVLSAWGIAAVIILLGENGFFADWAVETGSQEEFVLNSVVICITLFGVPLSLKFYNLCTQHSLRRVNNDEALHRFLAHGLLRNGMLQLVMAADIVIYYVTGHIAGAMCALMAIVVLQFCWPKRKQLDEYMEKVNQDEQE